MAKEVKAAVLVEKEKLETKTFPYPEIEDDWMLVKILGSGVCGSDKHLYQTGLPYPSILGHENVAEIVEIGDKALEKMKLHGQTIKKGDRIMWDPMLSCGKCFYCSEVWMPALCENGFLYGVAPCSDPPHLFGGYAEYAVLLPGLSIHRVPQGISTETAVLLETFSCGSRAVERAYGLMPKQVKEGVGLASTMYVIGAGPIGLTTIIAAKMLGIGKIIASDLTEHRLKVAEKFGADHIINSKEKSMDYRIREVMELTDSRGPDIVVECAGVPDAMLEGLKVIRRGGVFIEVGHFVESATPPITFDPAVFCHKELYLAGQFGYPDPQMRKTFRLAERLEKIGLKELVTHKFKVTEAKEAIKSSINLECIKALIIP